MKLRLRLPRVLAVLATGTEAVVSSILLEGAKKRTFTLGRSILERWSSNLWQQYETREAIFGDMYSRHSNVVTNW